jgi:hypothetical protein
MSTTYRITLSGILIADADVLLRTVFPLWNGEPMSADSSQITVTFASPQTPADLGPLVKVEVVS